MDTDHLDASVANAVAERNAVAECPPKQPRSPGLALCLAIAGFVLNGCGGEKIDPVSYAPAPLAGPLRVVPIPDFTQAGGDTLAANVPIASPIKRGAGMVFEGRFRPPADETGGYVNIAFFGEKRGIKRVQMNSAAALSTDAGGGWYKYRVEVKSPVDPAAVDCEVEISHRGKLLARGDVRIE